MKLFFDLEKEKKELSEAMYSGNLKRFVEIIGEGSKKLKLLMFVLVLLNWIFLIIIIFFS